MTLPWRAWNIVKVCYAGQFSSWRKKTPLKLVLQHWHSQYCFLIPSVCWFDFFNAVLFPKRHWQGRRSRGGGGERDTIPNDTLLPPERFFALGETLYLMLPYCQKERFFFFYIQRYLMLPYDHQSDFCIERETLYLMLPYYHQNDVCIERDTIPNAALLPSFAVRETLYLMLP